MRHRPLVLGLSAAIVLALTLVRADEPKTAEDTSRIGRLIQQLGANSFKDREQARKALETIGTPALPALRKATKQGDLETSRRAAELIRTIEEKAQTASMLAPKMVHLKVQDVPVLQAVDKLAKLSGYAVRVDGDRTLLTGKKVTLDTGNVTFWEALDRLGEAAGLAEKMTLAAIPGDPNTANGFQARSTFYPPLPPGNGMGGMMGMQGGMGAPPAPGRKARPAPPPLRLLPLPAKSKGDEKPKVQAPDAAPDPLKGADAPPKALPKEEEGKDKPPAETAGPPPMVIPGVVILMPSATAKQQASYAGAVRVFLKNAKPPAGAPKAAKHYDLILDASAEPRLLGFGPNGVPTIARAIDEHGQALTFVIDPQSGQQPAIPGIEASSWGAYFDILGANNSVSRGIAIRLQQGAKPAKRLKELTGTLPVQVLMPNSTLAAHDLKAINKSTDVKGGGQLVLRKFDKTAMTGMGDTYTVVYVLEGQPNGINRSLLAFRGNKQVAINDFATHDLRDAKGNRLVLTQGPMLAQEASPDGQTVKTVVTTVYRCEPGQGEPVQLVLTGTHVATVVVPFSFVDVPLP